MAKPQPGEQPGEEARQADLHARIMDEAESRELQAMSERMNSLLRNFYSTADVHTMDLRTDADTKHDQAAATTPAAQGGNDEHKD